MTKAKRPGWPALALLLLAVAISVPLVLGLFGAVHPALDSLAHFRLHLAAAMGLAALPLLFTSLWREGLMALTFAAAIAATAMTGRTGGANAADSGEQAAMTFSLVQFNTRFNNADPKALVRLLAREQPDIVTLQEVSAEMRNWLERTSGTYAYQHYCESGRIIGGAAILSRRPWAAHREPHCAENGYTALAAVDLAGTAVDVAAIHLHWPWPYGQPAQIERMEPLLGSLGAHTLIAGDFNATPWSAAMRAIATASRADVLSPGPTWLSPALPQALRPMIGLPIDHMLVKGITPLEPPRRLGDASSDHLPVTLRFSVPVTDGHGEGEERQVVQASMPRSHFTAP